VRSHPIAREKLLTVQDDYKKIFCTGFFQLFFDLIWNKRL
jgi:hypothetical protein